MLSHVKGFYSNFIFGCSGSLWLHRLFSGCGGAPLYLSAQAALSMASPRCRAWAGGCVGFRSCGSQGLEHSLNSCGAWLGWSAAAGSWIRIELTSSALTGGFFTIGKSQQAFQKDIYVWYVEMHRASYSNCWSDFPKLFKGWVVQLLSSLEQWKLVFFSFEKKIACAGYWSK